ncbi:4Fe-4S binding protein [Coprococcus comes]|uniref:4Fe-4S binding protein n=1 Tax=Coprococcus comes TaxID=410072 RepID=UPI00321B0FD9
MMRKNNVLRKYIASLLLFLLFETVAITLWKAKGNLFYLLNFSYIGGCLALGTALFTAGKRYARHFLGVLRRQQSTTQSRRYSVHCFSILLVHCDESKCVHCGKCLRVCPMNVEVNKESRKRKRGTECILCYECTKVCPTKALH